jgi:hypothetical protein
MKRTMFGLTQITINALNAWTQFAPHGFLPGSPDVPALPSSGLAPPTRLALHWQGIGFEFGFAFFGFALLLECILVFRSSYSSLPRWASNREK